MIVTPFRPSHLEGLVYLPQADALAFSPSETYWAKSGQVVACYGCLLAPSHGRGSLWIVKSPLAYKHTVGLTRRIIQQTKWAIREYGLWRVDMTVDPANREAVYLIEYMGFTFEARLYGYGPEGQPFDQYAWVREKERVYDR